MSELCKVARCGYVAKTTAALAAHQKFIHDKPGEAVPEQPSITPIHGTHGPKRPLSKAAQKKALGESRVLVMAPTRATKPKPVRTVMTPTILGIRKDDMTREQWLLLAVEKMRPDFEDIGRAVPPVRISIGWPGGRTARLDPLGQCWGPGAVGDGIQAIFITPSQDDPVQVLATTRHEMVHAAGEMHHRAGFRKLAAQVGFDPQPGASGVSSTYRTPALQAKLKALYAELGPFPHSPVAKGVTLGGAPKVQSTRMLKVICRRDGYAVRTTAKWIEVGLPSCPKGHPMKVVAA